MKHTNIINDIGAIIAGCIKTVETDGDYEVIRYKNYQGEESLPEELGPAYKLSYKGKPLLEYYKKNGKLHRSGGMPVVIIYYENHTEYYYYEQV